MTQVKEKNQECPASPDKNKPHRYLIIRGSGKIDGIATWQCQYCKNKTKSH